MNDHMIGPTGFIGASMAVQGITDATVVLHGQTGCRKGLLGSQNVMPRTEVRDPAFYGGGTAIPYSNIRPEDYYSDTSSKLGAVMDHVCSEDYALRVLMFSPGISIVGDDCDRYAAGEGTMVLDTDRLSDRGCVGFDQCIRDILEGLHPEKGETVEGGVNILGLSIMHKDWYSFRHELGHFLKDAGLKVVCPVGAGCTVDELRRSVNASFNIVVDPAYSAITSRFYSERYCIPSVSIGCCPIGFDATEEFMHVVGDAAGTPLSHGLSMVRKAKRRAYGSITASGKRLVGKTFDIVAEETTRAPLGDFLRDSFGMVEDSDRPDYLFAPGDIALLEQRSGNCGKGVDIGFPSSSTSDFLKKPLMGIEGTMYLLDSLFNRRACRTLRRGASSPGCAPGGCPCP